MKNILITGCSRGIGLELVKAALKQNYLVHAISRNTDSLNSIKNKNLYIYNIDITNQKEVSEFFGSLKEKNIKLDVLINNAGALINKSVLSFTTSEVDNLIDVNFKAPFFVIQNAYSLMNLKGKVINIGSMGGVQGTAKFPGLSIYSSTKGALAILTECLAEELKDKELTFNCFALGAVQTEMLNEAFPNYKAPITPQQMAEFIFNLTNQDTFLFNGKVLPISLSTP